MTSSGSSHYPGTKPSSETLLVHGGRASERFGGLVNVPIHRGSTVLFPDLDAWNEASASNPHDQYGRFGNPTTRCLEDMVARLENGHKSMLFPSGLSACCHSLLSFLKAGDHILMTDNVYGPVRTFALNVLSRINVEVSFYDPLIGAAISRLIQPNTRVVYVESPGSWTFEVQDIPAIAEQAHRHGAVVILDNSWATPMYFQPFAHGVDVSVQAATKYLVGHSDALLGIATANKESWPTLQKNVHYFGQIAGPDDAYLALRGLRTLDVRLRRHWENGVALAQSLLDFKIVRQVLHPALPQDPGHALWKRDFTGASGLFAVVLNPVGDHVVKALFDRLQLFGIGLSWGGFESLVMLSDEAWMKPRDGWGPTIRIHAGLENASDLIEDMGQAFRHACAVA